MNKAFECKGYFVDGAVCSLLSDLSKVEKDGVTNNLFQKGNESPIPTILVNSFLEIFFNWIFKTITESDLKSFSYILSLQLWNLKRIVTIKMLTEMIKLEGEVVFVMMIAGSGI